MPDSPTNLQTVNALQFEASELTRSDPLARAFLRISPNTITGIFLFALVINTLVHIGGGFLLSAHYQEIGIKFQSAFDPQEMPFVITTCINMIVGWTFSVWQLHAVVRMLSTLVNNQVIEDQDSSLKAFIHDSFFEPLNSKLLFWLALLAAAVGMGAFLVNVGSERDILTGEYGIPRWWQVSKLYQWSAYVPTMFIGFYAIISVLLRHILLVRFLDKLFSTYRVKLIPFHCDGTNGMGSIGAFAIRFGFLGIYFGFYVAYYIGFPLLLGRPLNINYTTVLLFILYLVLLPVCLIPPVWAAHKAMKVAKDIELENIASQMRKLLISNTADITKNMAQIEGFRTAYDLLKSEYHNWPFSFRAVQRFSVAAVMPIASTVVTVLLDAMLSKTIQ